MVAEKNNQENTEEILQNVGAKNGTDDDDKNKADSAPTPEPAPELESESLPVAAPVPNKTATNIAERLDESMKTYTPVNRSSDLIPLAHQFHLMRKQVRDLIDAAKNYDLNRDMLDKARVQFSSTISVLSEDSPIYPEIGSMMDDKSFLSVSNKLSKVSKTDADKFQNEIAAYVVDWEAIISARVDGQLDENKTLHDRLNHYQNKVEGLRKRTVTIQDKGKPVSRGLAVKLERNEGKLDQAWKAYERQTSKLCHMLGEITKSGWKDLYPLVANLVEWETKRASAEFDLYAVLQQTKEHMDKTVAEELNREPEVHVPPTLDASDHDSQTTGSYHPHDENSVASSTPEANLVEDEANAAKSPKSVAI